MITGDIIFSSISFWFHHCLMMITSDPDNTIRYRYYYTCGNDKF